VKDIQEILRAYEAVKKAESKTTLATIVKVKGSTFRRPGARMLIRDDGTSVGALSSGCLEADVIERAKKKSDSHDSITVTYDMTSPQNEVWGLNLGCNGIIQILLESLPVSARSPLLMFLSDCVSTSKPGVIASVFRVDGELKVAVGSHLFLAESGKMEEDIRHPVLAAALTEDCIHALRSKSSCNKEYRFTEGVVEALIEFIQPPLPLFIFGAGADAIPLARMANDLGWSVTVVDHRPAFVNKERFATADQFILARPEEVADKIKIDPNAAAVVLTHDFSHDLHLLRALLPSQALYVGLLGPSKRAELLLEKLTETGFTPTSQQRSRLHSPIGLDIGAESPEEIAVAILAEIQAFITGRRGGFLRDHSGPIHG
jgi:xanthine/CO dehydrogenase XdhC/CoxF family maturation factor